MNKLRDLTHHIYRFDRGNREYVPYWDMQDHFKEMNDRLEAEKETAKMWRKKYRLLCLQVDTVNMMAKRKSEQLSRLIKQLDKLAKGKNEHMRGIDAEPEWKLLLKYADFGSSENEPVSQDYDAMRDLANDNRETGTNPF